MIQWEENLEYGHLVRFITLLHEGTGKIIFLGKARITTTIYHFY